MAIPQTVNLNAYQGVPGVGVPPGGSSGQVLTKASGSSYDTEWTDAGGVGAVTSVFGRIGAVTAQTGDYTPAQVGATTIGASMFTLTNPGAVTFPRFNADNTVSALSASAFRTAIGAGTGDGDMTLAGVQTVTGAKTFNSGKMILAGSTSGTTTLNSAATAGTSVLTLPAGTGTLLSTISAVTVAQGGTGAATLTGWVKGTGTAALTGNATIPYTDISGLGTIVTQNADDVSLEGGFVATIAGGGLEIENSDSPGFTLLLAAQTAQTATRTLALKVNDADRTLTIAGNATVSGTNTGDQTITLTGDVTGSGTGSFAATIANSAVTLAKMANLAQDQFIGRTTASTGVPETATITAAARTVLDDTTVAAMVDTLGGAASTGTGGLARATSPTFVTPTLGAATATTVNKVTITAPATGSTLTIADGATLTVPSNATVSGTNTGDQTNISGNAATATALQTARTINGVSFNGTADITVTAAAGTLTGSTLASGVTASSLTSLGTIASLTATSAAISGGTIAGMAINTTTIGATTPSTGAFTTLAASGVTTITNTTAATSSTGALVVSGGVSAAKDSFVNSIRFGAGPGTYDASNTVIGNTAGNSLSGATGCTFVGQYAGAATVTTGVRCLYVGTEAGRYQTSYDNTGVGWQALLGIAGSSSGNANNAIGRQALATNTTGNSNNAMGYAALYNNTTGGVNTAVGTVALYSNTTGNRNTAIGYSALNTLTGSYSNNTGIGDEAGSWYGATYGVNALTQATQCTYIGSRARANANTVTNEMALGYNAVGDGSNTTVLGSSATTQTRIYGTVLSDAATPIMRCVTGKTNTGYVEVQGKTSGGVRLTGADAMGNTLILSAAAVATSDRTLTLPDPGGADTVCYLALAQTLGSKTLTAPVLTGNVQVDKTITAGGTTGAQTINKTAGSVNFAAAATSLVVTNSLVTTSSVIVATVATNDSTMKSVAAVAGSGSFTLYANAAATAETRVNFVVLN